MIQYPYALYLDSKIIGAARQLVSFFEQRIFDKSKTIIYLKKYKDSANIFSQIFDEEDIAYKFMRPSELDALEGQTIFYAFNAQSNCRFVANRKLKHIFITHGESNKVASIKPIIRIYDHVVMAGKLSLERYYKSGLFDEHDYETGRLLMMGDTFIGRTGFSSDSTRENVLFYAPTWEGGLESENYSSLQNVDLVYSTIIQLSVQLKFKSIVVQAHPNIGHRDNMLTKQLISLLLLLFRSGFKVYFYKNNVQLSWQAKFRLSRAGVIFIDKVNEFYALYGLVDISAMEFQCMNERIAHQVFYLPHMLRQDIPNFFNNKYRNEGIDLSNKNLDLCISLKYDQANCIINYSYKEMMSVNKPQRIDLMVKKVSK